MERRTGATRVAVTGMGIVASTANGAPAFARALADGVRGFAPVTLFDVSDQKTRLAGEVKGFDVASVVPAALRGRASRTDALGIVAADEAVRSARLSRAQVEHAAIVVGGTTGGMLETEEFFARVHGDPSVEVPLARLLSHPLSAPADHIAFALGVHGARRTICAACSSSANAIAVAADMLRRGECSVALAGGADALCRLTYSGFNALGAQDPNPCRPFDAARAGLNLGEGAAFLVLERLEDAQARGATIAAEILGVGVVSEAHHITNPQATGEGAARAMELALRDAGLRPEHVDYINAHGTGTMLNDAMECPALRQVLGEHASKAYVSSTKSLVGHTLGAAGAIEAVACLLAMENGFIPPTAGLRDVDPKCSGLRHVFEQSVEARVDVCLSNSFGFGGTDTVLCLGRPEAGDAHARTRTRSRSVVVTGLGAVVATGSGTAAIDAALVQGVTQANGDAGVAPLGAVGTGLDPVRSRRLNRFARMATDAVDQARTDAGFTVTDAARVGAAVGTGWGSLDDSAAFMRRVVEKGARLAPPADFPNLVMSAGVGHLSIYHGFKGPTLTAAALTVSGEMALLMAVDEILAGRADAMAAVGAEERNPLVLGLIDRLSVGSLGRDSVRAPRAEGSACVWLEAEEVARARGARPIARIAAWHQATYAPEPDDLMHDGGDALAAAVTRAVRAVAGETEVDAVVTALASPAVRDGLTSALGRFPALYEVSPRSGFFESVGTLAIAGAVRLVARGEAQHGAIALGTGPGVAYAILLTRP